MVDNGIIAGDFTQLYNSMHASVGKTRRFAKLVHISNALAGAVLYYKELTLKKSMDEAHKCLVGGYTSKFAAACKALDVPEGLVHLLDHSVTIKEAFPEDGKHFIVECIDGTWALFYEE